MIPGGESTTILRLASLYGLDEAIRSFPAPVFGTCAGMILLDRAHLGLTDLEVDRNAYGRQVASFEADLELEGEERPSGESSSARPACATSEPTWRFWPSSTASPCCCVTVASSSPHSTPS